MKKNYTISTLTAIFVLTLSILNAQEQNPDVNSGTTGSTVHQFHAQLTYGFEHNPTITSFRAAERRKLESMGYVAKYADKKEDPNVTGGAYFEWRMFPFGGTPGFGCGMQFGLLVDRQDIYYRKTTDTEYKAALNITSMELPCEFYLYRLFNLSEHFDLTIGIGGNYRFIRASAVVGDESDEGDTDLDLYDSDDLNDDADNRHAWGVQGKMELAYRFNDMNVALTFSMSGFYDWMKGEDRTYGFYFFNIGVRNIL